MSSTLHTLHMPPRLAASPCVEYTKLNTSWLNFASSSFLSFLSFLVAAASGSLGRLLYTAIRRIQGIGNRISQTQILILEVAYTITAGVMSS